VSQSQERWAVEGASVLVERRRRLVTITGTIAVSAGVVALITLGVHLAGMETAPPAALLALVIGAFAAFVGAVALVIENRSHAVSDWIQKQYGGALDLLPLWISVKDHDLRYVYMNKKQAEDYQIDPKMVIGRLAGEVVMRGIRPEDRTSQIARNEAKDRKAFAQADPMFWTEESFEVGKGDIRSYKSIRVPLRDRHAKPAGLLTVSFDITDLRQAESALRTSRELLLQSQRIGKSGYLLSEIKANKIYWSDSLFELRGVPKREWLTIEESRSYHHPDDHKRFMAESRVAIAEKREIDIELRTRRPDGSYRWEHMIGRPRYDDAGDYVGALIVTQDVTERKAIADDLIAANRAKSEFLANMSHELRTPLNAVIGYAEMIERQVFGPIGPKYLEYAADIMSSGQHLLEIIGNILDMSRIEAGEHRLDIQEIDLAEVASASLRMVRMRARERGLDLGMDIPERFPKLRGDAQAIRQVLINLLTNAVKFTPRGGRIDLAARAGARMAEITVSDTGQGMDAEDLQRVFAPFWQAESTQTKRSEGTGLGLSICKRLIEMQGGTISLTSTLGQGTAVTFALPIAPAPKP